MLKRALAGALLALAVCNPATPQVNPDTRSILERLDRLEAENSRLVEELRTLRAELAAGAPSAPSAPRPEIGSAADVRDRADVEEVRTAELDRTKVGAAQRFPITLTGMLLFNAFTNGPNSGLGPGPVQYPVLAAQARSTDVSGGSLRQTVVALRFNGPDLPGKGKASGYVSMDFFGAGSGNDLFRLRIATLDLAWGNTTISVGQDKPLIAPRDPVSYAQVGVSPLTAAGNLWDWNPQVRVERRFSLGEHSALRAQGSVYETTENANTLLPKFAGTLERQRPSYEGRLEFSAAAGKSKIEVAPGFHFGSTHVAGSSVQSNIASLDWMFRVASPLEFSGAVFRGKDVAGLGALQGFNVSPDGILNAVHTHGEWGQVALFPASRLSYHIYAGEQFNRPSDLSAQGITRNLVYAGNLIYKFAPNVLAAFEASQTRTEYLGLGLRLNNHYDLALAYLF